MSKHSRRSEHVQTTRGRPGEMTMTEREPGLTSTEDNPSMEPRTTNAESVGKYWVVIVLWAIGFVALIAFEIIAALFRR